jgi:Recombination endonuclease VII
MPCSSAEKRRAYNQTPARREANRLAAAARRAADPEGEREKLRAWQAAHAEKLAEYRAKRNTPERVAAASAARRARRAENPEPGREATRRWAAAHPDRMAVYAERRREQRAAGLTPKAKSHGVGTKQYAEMLSAQGGACAVCRRPETYRQARANRSDSLGVDHDHATGAVRGLLCRNCNLALGLVGDDAARLQALIEYLRRNA